MTVEIFSKQQFEKFLSTLEDNDTLPFISLGLMNGEESYFLPLDDQSGIQIRSSVKINGYSAESGKDSIRCWLVDSIEYKPLGSKISKWTTRLPNWETRLTNNLVELTKRRILAGDCKSCGKPKAIFKVKKRGPNENRLFAKCNEHNHFQWLDESHKPHFSPASHGNNREVEQELFNLNDKQLEAVQKPLTANIRVLAGPGSGKTTGVIVPRYRFLLDNGVSAESILAVTFSKSMADELLAKILKVCPDISSQAKKQICTIHAFCYRLLLANGDNRKVAKHWQIKKMLKEIIDTVWKDDNNKPSWSEVSDVIVLAKFRSKVNDWKFYEQLLGPWHGPKVHQARQQFDSQMRRQRLITFPDMLFDVEQKLINEAGFRGRLQAQYQYVIVDEAQDTNEQALRILTTISQDVGWNKMYQEWK